MWITQAHRKVRVIQPRRSPDGEVHTIRPAGSNDYEPMVNGEYAWITEERLKREIAERKFAARANKN